MVTKAAIEIYVELLYDWLNMLLCENARASFFLWLSDHTKMQILFGDKEKLAEWLLDFKDPKKLCGEVLTIHAEILWWSRVPRTQKIE
jgi:hypothetical protein